MVANKTKVVLLLLIVVAIGVAYRFVSQNDERGKEDAEAGATSRAAPGGQASDAGQAVSPGNAASGVALADLVKRYRCPGADMDCASNPNVASSEKEALWMVEHGYPTLDQIRDLDSKSTAEYEADYKRTGSKVSQTLWAFSLSTHDQVEKATAVLGQGLQQGNIFAYYVLSDIYMRQPDLANLTTSAGYMRGAYLAGDAKAGTIYAQKFGHLSPPEHANADKVAFEYFTKLGKGKNYPRP